MQVNCIELTKWQRGIKVGSTSVTEPQTSRLVYRDGADGGAAAVPARLGGSILRVSTVNVSVSIFMDGCTRKTCIPHLIPFIAYYSILRC